MSTHTLSPAEEKTIARKAHATLKLSCNLRPDAMRRDLAIFTQEVLRLVNAKRLKTVRLVLLELDKEDA